MPELPEVETTRLGLNPWLEGCTVRYLTVRQPRLRWQIDPSWAQHLPNLVIQPLLRRAKYLLMPLKGAYDLPEQGLIWHLGMSGSLRLVNEGAKWRKHDHLELVIQPHIVGAPDRLRYHDPRRFGALLYYQGAWLEQPVFAHLGVEPLSQDFQADWLYQVTRDKRQAIKVWLMNPQRVVGVGNIYATEALFQAHIDPRRPAGSLTKLECQCLVDKVKSILAQAIQQGGTTLRDFVGSDGQPGYFAQTLQVYGRAGATCLCCSTPLVHLIQAQRRTVFCPNCQV